MRMIMTNNDVINLISRFEKQSDITTLKSIINVKELLTEFGMEIAIDNDSVDLVFTKNLNEEGEPYIFTFNNFGYELLDLVFHSIGFKSDLV